MSNAPFRLTNLLIFRFALLLLLAQLAVSGIVRVVEVLLPQLAVLAAVASLIGGGLLLGAVGAFLLLTFWADANPSRYLRLVDPNERGHPLSVLAVAYLVLSIIVCFGNAYASLFNVDQGSFRFTTVANPNWWHFVYFSALMTATIAFGDIVPASAFARALVAMHIGTAITVVVGLGASVISGQTARIADRYRQSQFAESATPEEHPSGEAGATQDGSPT